MVELGPSLIGYADVPCHQGLARLATHALLAEAALTPKPALVDQRGSGAHGDLTLKKMRRSAYAIEPFFEEMASAAAGRIPDSMLREQLGQIGRRAEAAMLGATGGSNSHRGAIWALGLLTAAAVMRTSSWLTAPGIATQAAEIASLPDKGATVVVSHGLSAGVRYGVRGARGEAQLGFPHVISIGLPMLRRRRMEQHSERYARLDTLLAIMAVLDDTCLLHRGGIAGLATAKQGASEVLDLGGAATDRGMKRIIELDAELLRHNASPGGSADLLAATLFLDNLESGTGLLAYGND